MAVPRVSHSVFSDDIRHEVGGKTSLIGIYHGDMVFNVPPPVIYPKLCVTLWVISEANDSPKDIKITVLAPNRTEITKIEMSNIVSAQHREDAKKAILTASFAISPLHLKGEGFLEVWLETDREKIRAGLLQISFKDSLEKHEGATV